jgi:hypothetical protein
LNYLVEDDEFDVWIYHPTASDEDDDWPEEQRFPVVFMSPGADQRVHGGTTHLYLPMLEAIARAGIVTIAVDPVDTQAWSSGKRRAALACAMIWALDDEDLSSHLAEAMALMGHSRGGSAAWLLTNDMLSESNLPDEPAFDTWKQCATVSIAQRFAAAQPSQDATNTNVPINSPMAPPFLALHGAVDEDTETQPITAFDYLYAESRVNLNGFPREHNDELFLLAYGYRHDDWGGVGGLTYPPDSLVSPYYVPKFLRWQILGEQQHRADILVPTAWNAVSGDFDPTIASSSFWTSTHFERPNLYYYSGCQGTMMDPCPTNQDPIQGLGRPLIFADYTQGITWNGASRFELDLFETAPLTGRVCITESVLPLSTMGGTVTVEETPDGMPAEVCQDSTTSLLTGYADEAFDAHDTGAMLVRWGGDLGGAAIRWSLLDRGVTPREISTATHLSFRVGNVLTDETADCEEPLDEITMRVELRDTDLAPDQEGPFVTITPIIDPQSAIVASQTSTSCRAAQFMHTVRIPLPDLCDHEEYSPLAVDFLNELVFHFPDDDQTHTVMIDSLELTHDPYLPGEDPHLGECPQAPASSWNCVADELVATQISCSGEPIAGACDVIDIEESPVPLPEVDDLQQGTFEGWVVHLPKGWLRDPSDPTEDELDDVLARCIAACELEYADDPFTSANCGDSDAFLEPTLRHTSSVGARVSVPAEHAHGDELFVGESLDCDLRGDCSSAFDENIGPSRLRRPTPAAEPLHRGEEWLLSVAGEMQAGSSYAVPPLLSDATAAMAGTVGYSRCAAGNAQTCPFYLASAELELLEPLELHLECDSEPVSHALTALTIRLAQPAFGVAEAGTSWNGFTPGGLVLEAEGVVDDLPFHTRLPIEQPVYVYAADGLLMLQGTDGFVIEFEIPCNGIMADIAVGWDLVEDDVLAGPPTLGIAHLPATMACPDELPLTLQWTNDPEADYESLHWIVDGVRLDGEFPTLTMTESHEITAVLRDSRGAAGSATTFVACE